MPVLTAPVTRNEVYLPEVPAKAVRAAEGTEAGRDLLQVEGVDFAYGSTQALKAVSLGIPAHQVTTLIGPSGCGKSTLLRCLNRLHEHIEGARLLSGTVRLEGIDLYGRDIDLPALRRRIGMVSQQCNPFPKSVYENIAFGLRLMGVRARRQLDQAVEASLRAVSLWDELRDSVHVLGTRLSADQQKRLCMARAIALEPEILLLDDPCAGLDPVVTAKVEELIHSLRHRYTIVMVTHNMQQAARISDHTAFLFQGKLIESDRTEAIFLNPHNPQTEAYVSGRFG